MKSIGVQLATREDAQFLFKEDGDFRRLSCAYAVLSYRVDLGHCVGVSMSPRRHLIAKRTPLSEV